MKDLKLKWIITWILSIITLISVSNGYILEKNEKNGFRLFNRNINYPIDNVYNPNMVNIGRLLFYDKRLSPTNTFSCANCHNPELAFADSVAKENSFINNKLLTNNTPSLVNLTFNTVFGHNGASNKLEEYIIRHTEDTSIMKLNITEFAKSVKDDTFYNNLLKKQLKIERIDTILIANAIGQYLRTILSINTPLEQKLWQSGLINKPNDTIFNYIFSDLSLRTKQAISLCIKCHTGLAFGGEKIANIGLDKNDTSKYKVPTIRNLQLTAPYMHDGRYKTLEEVVEFYNSGIRYNDSLNPLLIKNGHAIRLNLNNNDKKELISFLNTLIDTSYLKVH